MTLKRSESKNIALLSGKHRYLRFNKNNIFLCKALLIVQTIQIIDRKTYSTMKVV
jgi:hypothetical protein